MILAATHQSNADFLFDNGPADSARTTWVIPSLITGFDFNTCYIYIPTYALSVYAILDGPFRLSHKLRRTKIHDPTQ